jgi:filamentous hemagglutinin family protein
MARRLMLLDASRLARSLATPFIVSLGLLFPTFTSIAHALTSPITPSGLNTQVSDPIAVGGQTQYDITGGTRPGGTSGTNLFHSFGDFSVPTNNIIANFLNAGSVDLNGNVLAPNLPTSNILGRVTGVDPSAIFGTIQTNGTGGFGNANLFLMNPNGFLFGPNATVNVGGMATFTSADRLRLTDGVLFDKTPNVAQDMLLSASPVASFGFIGANPHAIDFKGGQLTVAEGTGVTLVGGDISLLPILSDAPSGITAPGRQIRLTSVAAGPGEVAADTAVPEPGTALGNITLDQGTILSTAGDPLFGDVNGGSVSIRGGQFVATEGKILTGPAMDSVGQGGAVTIATTDSLSFTSSSIDTSSFFAGGNAGAITVSGSQVSLQDTFLVARAESDGTTTGSGGDVTLTGTAGVSLTGSTIDTDTFFSKGNGGAVTLTAPIVSLKGEGGRGGINTGVFGDGATPITASGGAVTLSGTTSVSLQRSTISTVASETQGNSGAVTITAPLVMIVGSPDSPTTPSIDTTIKNSLEDPNAGHGGDIEITGTNVTLTDSARLQSFADAPKTFSRGGDIRIAGSNHILLDNGTFLLTSSTSQGRAGNIGLVGQHVTIRGGSELGSETFGPGSGGTIRITGGENIAVESASEISTASAFTVGNQGSAGTIEFNTQQLTVTGGSQVSSSTARNSAGGSITVNAIDQVIMTGDASITTSSNGSGNAGNIQINAGQNFAAINSTVTTQANQASGGTIKITTNPSGTVQLINSLISASVLDGTGGGGSVDIDPQYVLLQNSQILAEAVQGPGGNITITITNGGLFLSDANSVISTSSQFGVNGTVTIQSPNAPASGHIQPLDKSPLIATSLLNQRCASLAGGEFSSFTVAGRDSLPTEPDSWLASPLATLNAGMGLKVKAEGGKAEGERLETPLLSLRQIAPAGFLTQAFAVDWSASCQS